MTTDIPLQRTTRDKDIAAVHALTSQGVLGPLNSRWPEMQQIAFALGIRPEDAVYRVRDGIWSDQHDNRVDTQTLADVIREAATR